MPEHDGVAAQSGAPSHAPDHLGPNDVRNVNVQLPASPTDTLGAAVKAMVVPCPVGEAGPSFESAVTPSPKADCAGCKSKKYAHTCAKKRNAASSIASSTPDRSKRARRSVPVLMRPIDPPVPSQAPSATSDSADSSALVQVARDAAPPAEMIPMQDHDASHAATVPDCDTTASAQATMVRLACTCRMHESRVAFMTCYGHMCATARDTQVSRPISTFVFRRLLGRKPRLDGGTNGVEYDYEQHSQHGWLFRRRTSLAVISSLISCIRIEGLIK